MANPQRGEGTPSWTVLASQQEAGIRSGHAGQKVSASHQPPQGPSLNPVEMPDLVIFIEITSKTAITIRPLVTLGAGMTEKHSSLLPFTETRLLFFRPERPQGSPSYLSAQHLIHPTPLYQIPRPLKCH